MCVSVWHCISVCLCRGNSLDLSFMQCTCQFFYKKDICVLVGEGGRRFPLTPPAACSPAPSRAAAQRIPLPSAGVSVTAVAAGFGHTCAVASGGGLWCWGWNVYGQLGIGSTADQHSPVAVSLGAGVPRCELEASLIYYIYIQYSE